MKTTNETTMTNLSPAAQAVIDAYWATPDEPVTTKIHQAAVAAALRAVVQELKYFGITEKNILAIAAELEAQ